LTYLWTKISFTVHPSSLLEEQLQDAQRKFLLFSSKSEVFRNEAEFYEREMYRLKSVQLKGDFE